MTTTRATSNARAVETSPRGRMARLLLVREPMTKRTFRFRRFAWLGASLLVGCGGARPRNVSGDGSGEGPLRATADATTSEVVLGVEAAGAEHPRAGAEADVHAVSVDALVVEALRPSQAVAARAKCACLGPASAGGAGRAPRLLRGRRVGVSASLPGKWTRRASGSRKSVNPELPRPDDCESVLT